MSKDEWLAVQVGDILIDHQRGGARRTVLKLSRVSGKRGQRGTRTCVQVANLKSRGRLTYIVSTEDLGGVRFEYVRPEVAA